MTNRPVLHPFILSMIVFVAAAFGGPGAAHAGNAAPLGQEIGTATITSVQATVGKATTLADSGINEFTGGRMLAGDGKGLGVDGLSHITFIFDRSNVLQGVVMTLPSNVKPTFERLRKKYTLVSKQIPFVGDSSARFSEGTSFILLDAPHLSFEMTITYVSATLLSAFKTETARDQERHDRAQWDKL